MEIPIIWRKIYVVMNLTFPRQISHIYNRQGQRQLGLDFIWDNGQLTWINKQLGSTIDQDKKIHWD